MPNHQVEQGETVPAIAAAAGFTDYTTVWNHADNAELKENRDPCVLAPGDRLVIPEKKPISPKLATGKVYRFTVTRPKLSLAIVLQDASGKPRAGLSGTLACDDASFAVTADGGGKFLQKIPIAAKFAQLTLADVDSRSDQAGDKTDGKADAGEEPQPLGFLVGNLDPLDLLSGWRARLANLGYPIDIPDGQGEGEAAAAAGDPGPDADAAAKDTDDSDDSDAQADPDAAAEEAIRLALEEFQCENGLTVTGKRDDVTKAKLLEVHGS